MEVSKNTQANSFYVIISGLLKFNPEHIDTKGLSENYINWKNRIFEGNYTATFNYLNNSYYDGYLNNIFPEIRYKEEEIGIYHKNLLNHLTHKNFLNNTVKFSLDIEDNKEIKFYSDYIDLYLFPHNIGIFSIKFWIKDISNLKIGVISDFLNKIRQLNTVIKYVDQEMSLREFIEQKLISWLKPDSDWVLFNPQLKSYILIDLPANLKSEELDYLLYDIGNISVVGSAKGDGIYAPSEEYYKQQLKDNKISVFKNWSALCLYDTFTRISLNFPDEFRSWEYDYFNLYIHCLYLKYFMYLTNTELSNVTNVTKRTETIRDEFIEFINDYYHSHISYKFLPDLMQDKLLSSLEVPPEIERMETKIKRINEHFQEKREKSFNRALITITMLSVLSVIFASSEWIISLGYPRSWMYPFTSIGIAVVIVGIIYYVFRVKRR